MARKNSEVRMAVLVTKLQMYIVVRCMETEGHEQTQNVFRAFEETLRLCTQLPS